MSEKERYANTGTWSMVFQEEGFSISGAGIKYRLENDGFAGITAKDRKNRVQEGSFYAESQVREACRDVLQDYPQGDEEGFLTRRGKRYGTTGAFRRLLGSASVPRKIASSSLKPIKGKAWDGRVRDFFAESEVRALCSDLVAVVPSVDDEGFVRQDGKRYATISTWIKILEKEEGVSISDNGMRNRVKKAGAVGETFRDRTGHLIRNGFYAESDIWEIFADKLYDLPQVDDVRPLEEDDQYPRADEAGFIVEEGKRYGTIKALSELWGISWNSINRKLQSAEISHLQGRLAAGSLCKFYSELEVQELCQEALTDFPRVDEDGCFVLHGVRYGTMGSLNRLMGTYYSSVRLAVQSSTLDPIKGRVSGGQLRDFYPEDEVRKLCTRFKNYKPKSQ